ncbi:MAG: hypothetical protein LBE08_09330, partial [Bifidobacteriaceae bacterium]|nr:hypothetical protein [Bifidobacteriaceae bacterium]
AARRADSLEKRRQDRIKARESALGGGAAGAGAGAGDGIVLGVPGVSSGPGGGAGGAGAGAGDGIVAGRSGAVPTGADGRPLTRAELKARRLGASRPDQ